MADLLPAVIHRAKSTTSLNGSHVVPVLIVVAGERASLGSLEFIADNIRNPHMQPV